MSLSSSGARARRGLPQLTRHKLEPLAHVVSPFTNICTSGMRY
jgi:hypothetical protein